MGNFIRNKLDGEGEHYRKDNSIYKGEFKNGKYDGLGKEIFIDDDNSKNNSVFEGFFQDGEKKYGKFEWSNGCKYQGNFFKNVFHGKGKYNWNEHKYYDGNWDKGEINGKGKFVYDDGSFYEGEFIKGKKFGKGKYVWNENKYYDGDWKNDKENGYGIYYYNEKITEGYWIDGKIVNKFKKNNLTMINKNSTFSFAKKIFQKLGSYITSFVSRIKVKDAASGFRALNRDAMLNINIFNPFTYTIEMLIQAYIKNLTVKNIDINVNSQKNRKSKLFKNDFDYIFKQTKNLIRFFIIYRPARFFALLGSVLLFVAFCIGIRFLYYATGHIQSLILCAIVSIMSFISLTLAILGDLISINRKMLERLQYEQRLKKYQK